MIASMIWQDFVIGLGQAMFAIALIPALRGTQKPPFWTCIITSITLSTFFVAFASLAFWWSAVCSSVCAVFWAVLAYQQINLQYIDDIFDEIW